MKNTPYTIATIGSHSALQILKGAKDEGFRTLVVTTPDRVSFYQRFTFIDDIIQIPNLADFHTIESQLKKKNCIVIPHGSFVAYLGSEGNKRISVPYFGNKNVLDWEGNRLSQMKWLKHANLTVPRMFSREDKIDRPVIVKSYGAAGGVGYFIANDQKDFEKKMKNYSKKEYLVQEYVIGVPIYLHFFYSPLNKKMELMSIDRRYETNVDALGRMPLQHQESIKISPSFVVVGNSPLVISESLLPPVYEMAERLIASSQVLIDKRGMWGPFCLETIVTPDKKFYLIEISCRIVAGTNLFIDSSPYASLLYDEPMSTGRRIAREIKLAIKAKKLEMLLD